MARTIAKDYDQKRLKILSVAAEVFAREGIARASMSEVAKSGGISKANIYHYYDSKDALVFDILDNYLSELRNLICNLELEAITIEEQLKILTQEFLLAYEGMDHQHKIQTEGLPLLPKEQQDILKSYQKEMINVVSNILKEASPQYFEENKNQLREVTMSVFGMLNWFYMWNPHATKQARIDYAKTISKITLNGIKGF